MSEMLVGKESIIPVISTEVFRDNPKARFATGLISQGIHPKQGLEELFTTYAQLRAGVYVDETQFLPPEAKLENGTEIDEDDYRSSHFCVIENLGSVQRVVASMRVIHGGNYGMLPIEKFFPDIPFSTNHSGNAIEISRYICRHEEKRVQRELKWVLYPTVLSYIMQNNLGPTYAVIDENLESSLLSAGVPVSRIAEPVFLEKYNSHNVGVMIDTEGLAHKIESKSPGAISSIDFSEFTFSGDVNKISD